MPHHFSPVWKFDSSWANFLEFGDLRFITINFPAQLNNNIFQRLVFIYPAPNRGVTEYYAIPPYLIDWFHYADSFRSFDSAISPNLVLRFAFMLSISV